MTTYYVATLARYVLVEAENEAEAFTLAHAALYELYADIRERLGKEVPIEIKTLRPATDEEIEFMRWHREAANAGKRSRVQSRKRQPLGEPFVDPDAQAMTDWTPLSVPGARMPTGRNRLRRGSLTTGPRSRASNSARSTRRGSSAFIPITNGSIFALGDISWFSCHPENAQWFAALAESSSMPATPKRLSLGTERTWESSSTTSLPNSRITGISFCPSMRLSGGPSGKSLLFARPRSSRPARSGATSSIGECTISNRFYGTTRRFTAHRATTTTWAPATVVEPIFTPEDEQSSNDEEFDMATKQKTKKAKAPKATKAKADGATKKAKAPKEAKEKKLSAIDAAAQVLAASKEPLNTKQMIEQMAAKGLWTSPGGKTPHATLYSAIIREIATKGKESRFVKKDRGQFAANS